jgi:hemerythrin superfamily protein
MRANTRRRFPSITSMIRMDHTHVLTLLHRYHITTRAERKWALARNACLALEVHAQLEEEIFYPAMRRVLSGNPVLDKSVPEHDEMRTLVTRLRGLRAGGTDFDDCFLQLMRVVLHHVADEETTLIPEAERRIPDQLGELGAEMTRRRVQLLAPHVGEVAVTTARAFPILSMVAAAGALTLGVALLGRNARGSSARASLS